jgi:hypothetical protein
MGGINGSSVSRLAAGLRHFKKGGARALAATESATGSARIRHFSAISGNDWGTILNGALGADFKVNQEAMDKHVNDLQGSFVRPCALHASTLDETYKELYIMDVSPDVFETAITIQLPWTTLAVAAVRRPSSATRAEERSLPETE